jgi:hypothetical protein
MVFDEQRCINSVFVAVLKEQPDPTPNPTYDVKVRLCWFETTATIIHEIKMSYNQ